MVPRSASPYTDQCHHEYEHHVGHRREDLTLETRCHLKGIIAKNSQVSAALWALACGNIL